MIHIRFGTDGWRAIIGEEFTFANVRRVADALGQVLPQRSSVVIGYDYRFLSDSFALEAGAVLASQKHRVTLLSHATTTPALSFAVRALRAKAGVMISASHNPALFNGVKIKLYPGHSADPEFTRQVEDAVRPEVPHA
ncbi:MAG TPA: phosphoglucomutase/phosphomannomutase family protein, partial [Elusimicrobiota bacterium]|nr:phosphoglucomutase/phosphomannomutase family protein [Elusimicrobiota bacterium]